MAITLNDEAVLSLSSLVCTAYGLHTLLAPFHALNFYMAPGTPGVEAQGRWIGFGLALSGIQGLVVANSAGSLPAKRNLLKSAAVAWAVAAAMHAYYAANGQERQETGYVNAAVGALISAVAAWRAWGRRNGKGRPDRA